MKNWSILPLLALLAVFGCHRVVNVETETPPGSVPPPDAVVQPQNAPLRAKPRPAMAETPRAPGPVPGYPETEISAFQAAYERQGQPRILIFLNKELSDEVRQWRRQTQIRVAFDKSTSRTSGGNPDVKSDKQASLTVRTEQPIEAGDGRVFPGEKWMWAFETGFIQSLLTSKANLVDHSTILRLEAQSPGGQQDPENLKTLEIAAMKKYAEIYIEILISEDEASPIGYVFKSTAKDISTGRILAVVTLMNWEDLYAHLAKTPTYDSQGYSFSVDQFPSVSQASEHLAVLTMAKLAQIWN